MVNKRKGKEFEQKNKTGYGKYISKILRRMKVY
jgi:hypothetical protein